MDFTVDPADLKTLAQGLSSLLVDLEQAGNLQSLAASSAENPQLESAIEQFVHHWGQNVAQVQQNLKALTDRMDQAGEGYQQQEQAIHDGFAA